MVVDDAELEDKGGVKMKKVNDMACCLREERVASGGIGVEYDR